MTTFPFNTFSTNFPLSDYPFNSRTETTEITLNDSKNYCAVGFRPGFPLQASELNEIQDIFFLNNSLTTTMQYLWMNGADQYRYSPGWLGTTPLWPEKFADSIMGPASSNLFQYSSTDAGVQFKAFPGWYYVYVRSSGHKHWVYLNETIESSVIEGILSTPTYVGINVSYSTITPYDDALLFDNSGINNTTNVSAGASRIKINIDIESGLVSTTDFYSSSNFSPIAKVVGEDVLYMNLRPVPSV